MTLPDGKYCRWTCTGRLLNVEAVNDDWHPYRILTIESDPGPIYFYDHNITHFERIDTLDIGTVISLSGIVTPENQARQGKSPYFLKPSAIEVF